MRRTGTIAAIVCAALAGGCFGGSEDSAGCDDRDDGVVAAYTATSPRGGPPSSAMVDDAVEVMCKRVQALGAEIDIRRRGADRIEVRANAGRTTDLDAVTAPGRLAFYDWEPNVYGNPDMPHNSITDAIEAAARAEPRAEETDIPPGGPAEEVERRFRGDARAIREHYDSQNDSAGDKHYLLDDRGRLVPPPSAERGNPANAFLAEPVDAPPGGKVVKVPRGVAIVKTEPPEEATENTPSQFFVIEDDAELTGAEIESPEQNFDQQTQEPIVTMKFTERGKTAFARVTERIAERGQTALPQPGQLPEDRFQRFMIALDGQIVSLATIDHAQNPEGISGSTGAQINGIGSIEETRDLAGSLRIGELPVRLQRVR